MNTYCYSAFGLNFESEIEIPEFLPAAGNPQVFIKLDKTPEALPNPSFSGVRFQASSNQFLLKVDKIASYLIEKGETIYIEPKPGATESDIRLFLLGSAIGALIHQRGLLPMHGSCLVIDQNAYIISGISGAGKSTLAAALVKKGYSLLSDDISVVSLNDKSEPFTFPGYPQMKLWADSLKKLGLEPSHYSKIRERLNKHAFHVKESFANKNFPLNGVYILSTKNTEGISMSELKGIEKFNAIKNNTYRLNFIKGIGNTGAHFKHISALAKHCDVKQIARPSKGSSIQELIALIEKDCGK